MLNIGLYEGGEGGVKIGRGCEMSAFVNCLRCGEGGALYVSCKFLMATWKKLNDFYCFDL